MDALSQLLAEISDDSGEENEAPTQPTRNKVIIPDSPEASPQPVKVSKRDQFRAKPSLKPSALRVKPAKNVPRRNSNSQRAHGSSPSQVFAQEAALAKKKRVLQRSFTSGFRKKKTKTTVKKKANPALEDKRKAFLPLASKGKEMDPDSGIATVNRKISVEAMRQRLRKFQVLKLQDFARKAKCNGLPEQWAIYAIIGEKINKTSKAGNSYLMMRLIDWDTEVSAFIFKSELKKMFYKWVEGTVVCIANAKVLESQKKFEGVSIMLETEYQMKEIGTCSTFGVCKALKKDRTTCNKPVDTSVSHYCPYHIRLQFKKSASRRPDTNRANVKKPSFPAPMTKASNGTFSHGKQSFTASRKSRKRRADLKKHKSVPPIIQMQRQKGMVTNRSSKIGEIGVGQRPKPGDNIPVLGKFFSERDSLSVKMNGKGKAVNPLHIELGITNIQAKDPNALPKTSTLLTKNSEFLDLPKGQRACLKRKRTNPANPRPAKKRKGLLSSFSSDKSKNILKRQSRHADSLDEEKSRKREEEFLFLQKKEYEQEIKEKVTELKVNAYKCTHSGCKLYGKWLQSRNAVCKAREHSFTKKRVVKHFWKCKNCKQSANCIMQIRMTKSCSRCGGTDFVKTSCYRVKENFDLKKRDVKVYSDMSEYK